MAQKKKIQFIVGLGIIAVIIVISVVIFADGDGTELEVVQGFQQDVIESAHKSVEKKQEMQCPGDTRTCADGTVIHRVGEECSFESCPQKTQ